YIAVLARSKVLREPHYEDLFSLAYQAAHSQLDYTPNLAVVDFLLRLRHETRHLHEGFSDGTTGVSGLAGLADTACHFLHWVVHHKLSVGNEPRGLDVVAALAGK